MISLHENLLFSYFETPRDREQVNISRRPEPSEATKEWEAVVPESHFYHFPEANGENFLIILFFLWDKGIQQKQIVLYCTY